MISNSVIKAFVECVDAPLETIQNKKVGKYGTIKSIYEKYQDEIILYLASPVQESNTKSSLLIREYYYVHHIFEKEPKNIKKIKEFIDLINIEMNRTIPFKSMDDLNNFIKKNGSNIIIELFYNKKDDENYNPARIMMYKLLNKPKSRKKDMSEMEPIWILYSNKLMKMYFYEYLPYKDQEEKMR